MKLQQVGADPGRRSRRRQRATMVEINMTPMVDVMLVLLIVFMVTAPLLTSGVAVDLPQASELAAGRPGRAAERHDRRRRQGLPAGQRDHARPAGPAAAGDHRSQARRADLRARRQGHRLRHRHAGGEHHQSGRLRQGGAADRGAGGRSGPDGDVAPAMTGSRFAARPTLTGQAGDGSLPYRLHPVPPGPGGAARRPVGAEPASCRCRRSPITVEIVTATTEPPQPSPLPPGPRRRGQRRCRRGRRPVRRRRRRRPRSRQNRSRSHLRRRLRPPPKAVEPAARATAAPEEGRAAQARADAGAAAAASHPSRRRPSRRSSQRRTSRPRRHAPSRSRTSRPTSPRSSRRPEKPPTPPAPKQQESDFDALLRSVEQTPKRVQAPDQRDGKGAATVAGGTGQPGKAAGGADQPRRCWRQRSAGRSRRAGTSRSRPRASGACAPSSTSSWVRTAASSPSCRWMRRAWPPIPCSAPSPRAPCAPSAPARRSSFHRSPIRYGGTSSSTSIRRGWPDERATPRPAAAAGRCGCPLGGGGRRAGGDGAAAGRHHQGRRPADPDRRQPVLRRQPGRPRPRRLRSPR